MFYGEHLSAQELPPQCQTCRARASVAVFDDAGRSHGCFCLRCGRTKCKTLDRLARAFKGTP